MNEMYQKMLSAYDLSTEQQRHNAEFEVNQQIVLAGLYRGGFFDSAAFYGGTCLRIFHGLNRFSEDMDFSLTAPNENFQFEKFFPYIVDEFAYVGRKVEIHKKDKQKSFSWSFFE
jgi:predicted nucleotidyltransferase component of viral defense system